MLATIPFPMAGLIPLLIALVLVEKTAHSERVLVEPQVLWGWMMVLVGWWWLTCETAARVLASSMTPSATPPTRYLARWDFIAQVGVLTIFSWLCFRLGWTHHAVYYSLALAPWVVLQCLHWWCFAYAVRAITKADWTRWSYLSHHVRFALVPLAIALPLLDMSTAVARSTGLETWLFSQFGEFVNVAGGILLALVLVGFMPWLLTRMWGAYPVPAGPEQNELDEACRRAKVSVAGILIWPSTGTRQYNAMVLGVLPRLRYVLFTEDLLRDFQRAERLAVLGHELGHARYNHLWIYLLFALVTGTASWLARAPLEHGLGVVFQYLPVFLQVDVEIRSVVVALFLLGIQWRLLFGWLSRLCERQADLAGAALAGDGNSDEGLGAMRRALGDVARLAGIDPKSPSWRHYSIAQRIEYLTHVSANPRLVTHHHDSVRRTVRLMVVAACGLIFLSFLLHN